MDEHNVIFSSGWPNRMRFSATVLAVALLLACGGRIDRGPVDDSDPSSHGGQGGSAGTGTGGDPALEPDSLCGNGVIDVGEECDSTNLNGSTCRSALMWALAEGVLHCTSACTLDTSGCYPAGGSAGVPGTGGNSTGGFGGTGGITAGAAGTGGSGGADSLYTCLAQQGTEPAPMPPMAVEECGSFQGGPMAGFCLPIGTIPWRDNDVWWPWPVDICGDYLECVPKTKVLEPQSCFAPCESVFGPGACLPSYVIDEHMQGVVPILEQTTCDVTDACFPCIDPVTSMPSGACDN